MVEIAVPAAPPLGRLNRVELIHTGRWRISSGVWNASREDLTAAVAALDCPAVRQPIIKLGHSKTGPLWAGNPTGEPAIGHVDNLTLVNEGHTLVGDFVGLPGWFAQVAASAYPDRSVEGTYDMRCQLGHTHPFVLTAVALLGVTPPGVGTLRSLQDVATMYGVEAAADVHTGAMVALLPSAEDVDRLAVDGGEPADQLHITTMFLGPAADWPEAARVRLEDDMRALAEAIPAGDVDGFAVAAFNPHTADRDTAIVVELGGDGLEDVHGLVEAAVEEVAETAGVTVPDQHTPWRPHVTLAYTDDLNRVVEWADRTGPLRIDRIRVAFAGQHVDIPLTGEGDGGELDVDALTDGDMPDVDEVEAAQTRRVTRSDAPLRRYWLRGKGALKIRWNTPGDWTRCVRQLRKYVRDPKGLCSVYHKQATGMWTGDRRHRQMHAAAGFDPDQPRDLRGRWIDVMHLATPEEIADFRRRFGKAIPPGWSDVRIADDLDSAPLLVTGRDAKGRRQAIYSAEHTEAQAAAKFQRVQELDKHLDKLDHALERDAGVNDDAAALLLIRRLGLRPGSARDTRAATQAYGATTLQARHVRIRDGRATLSFTGKKGVKIRLSTRDPAVVDALQRRLATRTGRDRLFDTTEARTRDYMRSTGVPAGFLLKDLRTVHANAVALREIAKRRSPPKTKRDFQRWRREVATRVSEALGNTPALALSSYINPTVFTAWVADPAWVAAAASEDDTDAALARAEEKRLLAGWFATVDFDKPETGVPAVDPDLDDEDDDGRSKDVEAHARHNQKTHGNRYRNGVPIPGTGAFPKVEIPRREGPAKRGDILVAEHEPSSGTMEDATVYGLYEVTSVRTSDGAPSRARELAGAFGFVGYEHDVLEDVRLFDGRQHIVPGDRVDVDGLRTSLQERTYHPASDEPRTYESLDELGDILRRHITRPGRTTPKAKPKRPVSAEEEMALPNPNPTIVHAAAAVSVDDVRAAFYRQAPQQAWIREFHTSPRRLIVANDSDGTVARVDFDVDEDGQIRFSSPVPVRVEYVEQDADAEKVAASRMVYASAAESRPVAANVPGGHNQKTHGNRYRPDGSLIPRGAVADAIRSAYSALARGEGASIDAGELDGLLRALTGGGDEAKQANLARLDVGGYGTLFATDKTDALDRSKMPQLGTNEEEMRPFLDLLAERGVSVSVGEIDPTTLKPSQSEISGAKTGKLYGFMAKDGWLPGGLLVTSNDGYVVDGHHRWSGAAAVRASGARPDMTVTGLVVDRPIDEVLALAASVAKFESLDFDRTAQVAAAAVSSRPWSDFTEADYSPAQWRRATLLDRGEAAGDVNTKARYGLPVREPDGTLNRNGVHAAAGGHGIGAVKGISPELRRSAARALVRLYAQIGDEPPDSLREMAGMSMSASADPHTETPAAEPGNPTTMEEIMPLSTEVYQRLGLAEDADHDEVSAAVLAVLDKADGQPDPQQVAAAAAERDGLVKEVDLLKGQVEAMSGKLAEVEAEKAATVKASVLGTAQQQGKFTPADRSRWDKDYDEAPEVVTRVLASIAPGTAVPVNPHGSVGQPLDVSASDDDADPEPEWLFGPADTADDNEPAMAGKES